MILSEKRPRSFEDKINNALDEVSNIEPSLREKLFIEISELHTINDVSKIILLIRSKIGINKSVSRNGIDYWIFRGWSLLEATTKCNAYKRENPRNIKSAFGKEHWIEKGFTEEEAEYMRNSKRPIRKEYWMEKGFSEEESVKLALDKKQSNNKKGAKNSKLKSESKTDIEKKMANFYNVEFWLVRGYTEEESLIKIKEMDCSFNLEKCKLKHGDEEGYIVWKNRQERWQETMKSKPKMKLTESIKPKVFLMRII
jgi:hypothetical protein